MEKETYHVKFVESREVFKITPYRGKLPIWVKARLWIKRKLGVSPFIKIKRKEKPMKKDFKPGDKVTVISSGEVYCKGKIDMVYQDAVCVVIDAYKSCTAHKSTVFHGHNVKVEITGEELPERLRMEERKQRTIEFLDVLKGKVRSAKDVNLNFKSSPDPDSVSFEISGMIYM